MKAPNNTPLTNYSPDHAEQHHHALFDHLYNLHFKLLYRKMYTLVKDEAVTDGLLNELFLKLWMRRKELPVLQSADVLIYQLATDLVFEYFRKKARQHLVPLK